MKKKMIISFIVVATVMSFIGSSYSNNNTNDLLLDNIEALANGEQENGITCIGEGTVDCPIGIYCFFSVYYVLARNQKKRKLLVW